MDPGCGGDLAEALDEYASCLSRCRAVVTAAVDAGPIKGDRLAVIRRGKMLRPLVAYLAGFASGAAERPLTAAAAAVELLHTGSLVHDDIIDRAVTRRGLAALHTQVGADTALLVGDFLFMRAVSLLAEAVGAEPDTRLRAVAALTHYAEECCVGQSAELRAGPSSWQDSWYFDTAKRKTGAPFAAAAVLGVMLGGGGDAEVSAAHNYGMSLGVAYQIRDDMLDLVGQEKAIGKPVGNSLSHGRPLLPLIYLRAASDLEVGNGWVAPADRGELASRLRRHGVLERVRNTQQEFIDQAVAAVQTLPPSKETGHLAGLARWAGVAA